MGEVSTPQEQHRDIAIARFFDALTKLVEKTTELVDTVLEQEREESENPAPPSLRRRPGTR